MDLHFNERSRFTRWAVSAGILHESFVVVDVGVLGGENPRWRLLGDHLIVYGFDASEAAVADLRRQNAGRSNLHYYPIAIGNEDGERIFYFNAANPSSSSFYLQDGSGRAEDKESRVAIRKLDSLLAEGVISPPDFIKIDVEGFESDVLNGGQQALCRVLGSETETSFNVSPVYPDGHFVMMQKILMLHHLLVFDLNFNRIPRQSYWQAMSDRQKRIAREIGRPATINALFCWDLIDETDHAENYPGTPRPFTVDQVIKTMMICELHGLNDIAYDVAVKFRERLSSRLDVDKAVALLVDPLGHRIVNNGLRHKLAIMSLFWRDRLPKA